MLRCGTSSAVGSIALLQCLKISHEVEDAICVTKRKGTTITEGIDEGRFAHGLAAEAGRSQSCALKERFDARKQLFIGDDHASAISQHTLTVQAEMFAITESDLFQPMCEIADMTNEPTEPLLYRQLMAIKPLGMSNNKWLTQAGVNRSFFHDLKNRGRARTDIVDKLVEAVGVSPSEFYARNAPDVSPEAQQEEKVARSLPFLNEQEPRDIPILGTAMGTDFEITVDGELLFSEVTELDQGEVSDFARRPAALKGRKEVYGLYVTGESMAPRFRQGDPLYVDPKAQARIGDDVVLFLRKPEGDDERVYSVLIKELARSTSSFVELRQHNPALSFTVSRKDISAIHRVIPWRELTVF